MDAASSANQAVTDAMIRITLTVVGGPSESEPTAFPALAAAHSASDSAATAYHTDAWSPSEVAASSSEQCAKALERLHASNSYAYLAASADASVALYWPSLWTASAQPLELASAWDTLKVQLDEDKADWSFWIDWYEAVLAGKWEDWGLVFEIATQLDDADWDKGPAHVAEQIKLIRRSYRTSVSTRLIRLEIGKWDVEQDADIPAEPIEFAIAQVEIALAAALATDQGNGLSETSGETILIRKAGSDFKSLPSAVATSYWNACMGLQRNLGNLYPEDAPLIALQNVLYTSVEELCAQDPLIRDRVAKLAALETRRMPTTQEREDLQQVPDLVAEDLTAPALEQLSDAIDAVSTTERPARFWRAKLVNWLNTLGRGLDQAQKNEKRAMWLLKLAHRISGWFFDGDE